MADLIPTTSGADTASAALGCALDRIATASALSLTFAGRLAVYLTGAQWAEMRRRNAEAWDSPFQTCASHDFVDANDVMAEAFRLVLGREPAGGFETRFCPVLGHHVACDHAEEAAAERDGLIWSDAWCLAKVNHLMDTELADLLEAQDFATAAA